MKADAGVYWSKRAGNSLLNSILHIFITHGWHVMILFRLGKIIYAFPVPGISHILKVIFQVIWFLVTTLYGIYIDLSSNIGKGFYIGHFGAIVVGGNVGDFCSIGQGVTIGYKGGGKSDKWPTIMNNVYIGVGSKVIGDISIGSDSIIGANAVVTKSFPNNSLLVGIPAKNIKSDHL